MPASLAPWALQASLAFLGGRAAKETWDPVGGLEKKVTRALLVLKDLQGHQEHLVPQDRLATREKRETGL